MYSANTSNIRLATCANRADDDDDDNFTGVDLFLRDNDVSTADRINVPEKVSLPLEADIEMKATKILIGAYRRMLSVPPKTSRKSCTGEWANDGYRVVVANPTTTISRTSGWSHSGLTYLNPEEWLVFYERGTLRICDPGTQTNVALASTWINAFNNPCFELHRFRAYSILRRLGYIAANVPKDAHVHDTSVSLTSPGLPGTSLAGIATYSYAQVFNGLLQRAPSSVNGQNIIVTPSTGICTNRSSIDASYSVYTPGSKYKKRDPPTPQYTLIAQASTDEIPNIDVLNYWENHNHETSTLLSVSEPGSTGFLSIKAIEIQSPSH